MVMYGIFTYIWLIFIVNQCRFDTPAKLNIASEKWWVGRLLAYWEGNFSKAMLNFGRVYHSHEFRHARGINRHILRYIIGMLNHFRNAWRFRETILRR